MFAKSTPPEPDALPFWVEGTLSLFAFQALKQAKASHGYTGKPATMRKLAAKGLVRQLGCGAYAVTEAGQDLIEGCFRCPPEFDHREPCPERPSPLQRRGAAGMARDDARDAKFRDAKRRAGWTMPLEHYYPPDALAHAFPDRYGHLAVRVAPSQGVAGMVQAATTKPLPYTVEPVTGGCHVIRPRFGGGAGIRFRERVE